MNLRLRAPGGFLEVLQLPTKCSCNQLHFWPATNYISIMQQSEKRKAKNKQALNAKKNAIRPKEIILEELVYS